MRRKFRMMGDCDMMTLYFLSFFFFAFYSRDNKHEECFEISIEMIPKIVILILDEIFSNYETNDLYNKSLKLRTFPLHEILTSYHFVKIPLIEELILSSQKSPSICSITFQMIR